MSSEPPPITTEAANASEDVRDTSTSSSGSGESNSSIFTSLSQSILPPPQSAPIGRTNAPGMTDMCSQQTMNNSMITEGTGSRQNGAEECDEERESGSRRKNVTRESTKLLRSWLYNHLSNPYPSKGEKIMFAIITGMTVTQVSTWFANARRRLKKDNQMTWTPGSRSTSGTSPSQNSQPRESQQEDGNAHERMTLKREVETGRTENGNHQEEHSEVHAMPSFQPPIPQPWNTTTNNWAHGNSVGKPIVYIHSRSESRSHLHLAPLPGTR
ncbi:hypothetical protein Aperf_G00000028136 [Anoplocephala perfoliata]